ncbi:IQ-DOMAIN 14-like protein [Tanacetum coccineum]
MNIVVNASVNENMNVSVNVYDSVKMCHKCLELETELIKRHNMIEQDEYDPLSKSYSKLEQPCISHEIAMQLNKEIFQKENTYDLSQRVTVENDSTRMRSCMSASEKEQNKHVIAVAATTAAVAGAQAAVAVARRALRALKGLVKFQALFRGFLVRKRVAATLYSMQALLRAQLAVRSKRAELAVRYLFVQLGNPSWRILFLSDGVTVENDSTRMRSCMSASEKEQNKHAIAVAATTTDVAGAQAAVAVVRLTSDGRDTLFSGREKWAATKIQSVYRGHLARRALRALKGLVKFQALFRGFLVRKRVAATLYSMQALLRAQLVVRSKRAELAVRYLSVQLKKQNKHAIVVAATTIAVAGAQAALAVVSLTSDGKDTLFTGREKWAAIKIQSVYRGHLARRALRALKGLLKFQDLFRGFLVRKRVAATLYSMQALLRA